MLCVLYQLCFEFNQIESGSDVDSTISVGLIQFFNIFIKIWSIIQLNPRNPKFYFGFWYKVERMAPAVIVRLAIFTQDQTGNSWHIR